MSNRYAPTSRFRDGVQSAYDAGLSYFADDTYAATPLGDIYSTAAGAIGTIFGGPVGGATAGGLAATIEGFTGGTAVDQARLARVNYFYNLATQGNVAAAQLILGGPANVSGNESGMWTQAAQQLATTAPATLAEAQREGAAWLVGSGDTATNYPAMRRFTAAWAQANPFASAVGAVGGYVNPAAPITDPRTGLPVAPAPRPAMSQSSSLLMLGAVALGVYALTARRSR